MIFSKTGIHLSGSCFNPLINDSARDAAQAQLRRSMRLQKRGVSGVGAIQGRLAVAAHDIKHEIVAVFVGIDPERADLERLLRLAPIFKGKAQEGGLAVFALDRRQVGNFRPRIGGKPARIACARSR